MDFGAWISDYGTYLEAHGYAGTKIVLRLQHLSCLQRFVEAREQKTLEEFNPQLTPGSHRDRAQESVETANEEFVLSP